jgi:hypothetical protein
MSRAADEFRCGGRRWRRGEWVGLVRAARVLRFRVYGRTRDGRCLLLVPEGARFEEEPRWVDVADVRKLDEETG